jgi:hypothetical protein
MPKTPIIDALIELRSTLHGSLYSITDSRKEVLEQALADKLNSRFGNTEETLQFIGELTIGLKNFRLR